MTLRSSVPMVIGLLVASFAGGACYQWAFGLRAAHAQQGVNDEFRAGSLVIVDEAGNPRASLATAEDGTVSLVFTDPAGTPRLILGQADQTGIQLFDEAGSWRGAFSQGDAATGMNVTGGDDGPMIGMNAQSDGLSAGMYLTNAGGTEAFGLGSSPGGAGLGLHDLNGTVRTNMGVGDDGNAAFTVYDADGVVRAAMAVAADGTGSFAVTDDLGQEIWRVE